ncbi:uncharacterized protein PV07_05416 [Cladophialophora immunda]|uniref:Uncharacterized protein n=1 Tax=Cladophialophora immunda TaxID=569365 RepID=A0A0D2CER7_9EURO|nr:uncharacterized protein PV07_05416 [Cladophialophora immunda]KIW29613.1 hypothetical protein PV07_05416 [Cladophialophora immunda]
MRSSRFTTVRFVPQLDSKATQVERELEIANQKSHAARWSHEKRKKRKQEQKEHLLNEAQGHYASVNNRHLTDQQQDIRGPGRLVFYRADHLLQRWDLHTARDDSPSLLEILPGGNSDPFNAQALQITPQVNKLITFIRDGYLPGVYITSYMRFKDAPRGAPMLTTIGEGFHVFARRTVAKVWNSMKEEFSDEGRALSWCSSYMPVLAKFSSPDTARDLHFLAIKMRTKSMKILKTRIEKLSLDIPPDISLVSQIVSLFRAACKENDIPAAKIHANIIQRLVDRVETPDLHIRTLFMTCMNNDTELAIAQMRNTFFDFENWVQKQIARFWVETPETHMPQLPAEYKALHSSVRLHATRQASIRLRQYLFVRSTTVDLNDPEDLNRTDAVYTIFTTYSQYDSGALINAYINLIAGKGYKMKESLRYIEASLALTTLHILRRGIFEATVYGCDHRTSHHMITINHLEGTMQKALSIATTDELARYREALLWVFFYGARFEWRVNEKIKDIMPPRTWFTKMFARQAEILELTEWPQARDTLSHFVFYEFLEPYLATWFAETLAGNEPPQ